MNHIYDAIKNHLEMKTNGALLITGKWGSGKTYYIKNKVFPQLEQDLGIKPIIVSLYGSIDKNSIANKVLFAYLDKDSENSLLSVASLVKGTKKIIDSVPALKKYIDVNQLVAGSGEGLFRFLPNEKLLICFDDLERVSDKLNTEDLLGLINELVENRQQKVVIIANESVIKNGIKFKEKTIEKTVHFINNISEILDSILENYPDDKFTGFIKQHKDFFMSTLDPLHRNKEIEMNLRDSFENIRTLKFAIEHYQYAFKILENKEGIKEDLSIKKLKNIWLFVLAVSAEFKKENCLSYEDRKGLDEIIETGSLDLENIIWNGLSEGTEHVESKESYAEQFIDSYYKRITASYIFYPQIYNLITASVPIIDTELLKELDHGFKLQEGKINPAEELLSLFVHNQYYNLSEKEFKEKLIELLEFAENAGFDHATSYLNAAVYILGFSAIIDSDTTSITKKIEAGIKKFVGQVSEIDRFSHDINMISNNYVGEQMEKIVVFLKQAFKERDRILQASDLLRLQTLFSTAMPALFEELRPKSSVRTPDSLLFNFFDIPVVQAAINHWNPADFNAFSNLLQVRYIDISFFERLTDEIPFLQAILDTVQSMNFDGKGLSQHIVKTQLIPSLEESIKKLKAVGKDKNQIGEMLETGNDENGEK